MDICVYVFLTLLLENPLSCTVRGPAPGLVLWHQCSSLWTSPCTMRPQLPAEGDACKKSGTGQSVWVFELLQTWNQWSPSFQEIQLTPELRSKSINPTPASDNQWTWLGGSALLGLDWKWNLPERTELHGDHCWFIFSFNFSHQWKVTI